MTLSHLHKSLLAAGTLALASSASLAADSVPSLVYASGEALSPEAEMRLNALQATPGGAMTRDEVRQELAAARQAGTLAEGGESGETPRVLAARDDANARQTRAILAAHEAERQRLAALEAERVAREQAAVTAQAAAQPGTDAPVAPLAAAATDPQAAAVSDTTPAAPADSPAPSDKPTERPDTPAPAAPAPTLTLRESDEPATGPAIDRD